MARVPKRKELVGSRLLKEYAGWIYCTHCDQTVAYLCYVTYDVFDFTYQCACGSEVEVYVAFEEAQNAAESDNPLAWVKNRLCCPTDLSPLVTFVEKIWRATTARWFASAAIRATICQKANEKQTMECQNMKEVFAYDI